MKLWLSKNTEVPMREQLITQITLGVASGDLSVGEKLPSRQEIARRFKIHANTVSGAYQKLDEQGLIEFKKGSGFYVRDVKTEAIGEKVELETLITKFFQTAKSLGFSDKKIKESLENKLNAKTPESFLVVESDRDLRKILIEEIKVSTEAKVYGISFEDFKVEHQDINSNFVALFDEKTKIEGILNSNETCLYLKSGSIPDALQDETRPTADSLIAVVSDWQNFLLMAKIILVAAQVDADSILTRSTSEENWQRGLNNASIIICDSVTAKFFSNDKRIRTFPVISKDSIRELKAKLDLKS